MAIILIHSFDWWSLSLSLSIGFPHLVLTLLGADLISVGEFITTRVTEFGETHWQLILEHSFLLDWPEVHIFSGVISFCPRSFFCPRIHPGYHMTCMLRWLWTGTVSQTFPVFDDLEIYEEHQSGTFCMSLNWDFPEIFFPNYTGIMGLGGRAQSEVAFPSRCMKDTSYRCYCWLWHWPC